MSKKAETVKNINSKEETRPVQDRRKALLEAKQKFWERNSAFPSKLIENMQDLEKIYQLRYDVYCMQKKFLNPENYPEKKEMDVFDKYSLHFGAFDDLGNALGSLRLVKNSVLGFPLGDHCEIDVPDEILKTAGEISRLAVSKIIRKRQGDGEYGMAVEGRGIDDKPVIKPENNRRRHRPEIVVGLYKSLYQESKRQGITHWLAVMEPGLLKLLRRFYFQFEPVGPEVDYYGPVRPYMVSLESVEDEVYKKSKPYYTAFVEGLPAEYIKHPI